MLVSLNFCLCLQVANGACSILFKNFQKPVFYHDKDLNFEVIEKGTLCAYYVAD